LRARLLHDFLQRRTHSIRRVAKITFIGAGSTVFARNLLGDILGYDELAESEITLFDIDAERLDTSELVARRVAEALGSPAKINATTDRRAALHGADYAINMIQVGGYEPCTVTDFEVPKRFGLRQTIADTLGIGGIMRGLRTIRHCCVGRKQDNSSPQGRGNSVCESVSAAHLGRSESPISDSAPHRKAPRRLNATVPSRPRRRASVSKLATRPSRSPIKDSVPTGKGRAGPQRRLCVPKTCPGMLSRRFARPDRIRRVAPVRPELAEAPTNERFAKAANTTKSVRSRRDPSGGHEKCSNAVTRGRFGLIAQFRRSIKP
jgi:Family 4 glycosyl hydrolase